MFNRFLIVCIAVTSGLASQTAFGQCWQIEDAYCSSYYDTVYCSHTDCDDNECPDNTTESEPTNGIRSLGTSGHTVGYDGTVPTTGFIFCLRSNDCDNGCEIYGGVNRCENGPIPPWDDTNADETGKKYHEQGNDICGFFY